MKTGMPTRTIQFAAALALAASVLGCAPTKAGLDARKQASDRLNLISAQIQFGQAKQSFEVGQVERATKEIDAAIKTFADAAEFHVLKGRIYLETHKLEEALRSFETAIEKDPKFAEPHYCAGIVYQRWSNDREAHES